MSWQVRVGIDAELARFLAPTAQIRTEYTFQAPLRFSDLECELLPDAADAFAPMLRAGALKCLLNEQEVLLTSSTFPAIAAMAGGLPSFDPTSSTLSFSVPSHMFPVIVIRAKLSVLPAPPERPFLPLSLAEQRPQQNNSDSDHRAKTNTSPEKVTPDHKSEPATDPSRDKSFHGETSPLTDSASAFRETSFQDSPFPDSSFRDSAFPDSGFQDTNFGEPAFQKAGFRDSSFQDIGFQDPVLQESGLQEPAFHDPGFPPESGFEDPAFQDPMFAQETAYQDPSYPDPLLAKPSNFAASASGFRDSGYPNSSPTCLFQHGREHFPSSGGVQHQQEPFGDVFSESGVRDSPFHGSASSSPYYEGSSSGGSCHYPGCRARDSFVVAMCGHCFCKTHMMPALHKSTYKMCPACATTPSSNVPPRGLRGGWPTPPQARPPTSWSTGAGFPLRGGGGPFSNTSSSSPRLSSKATDAEPRRRFPATDLSSLRCFEARGPRPLLQVLAILESSGTLTHTMLAALLLQFLPTIFQRVQKKIGRINKGSTASVAAWLSSSDPTKLAVLRKILYLVEDTAELKRFTSQLRAAISARPGAPKIGTLMIEILRTVSDLPFNKQSALMHGLAPELLPLWRSVLTWCSGTSIDEVDPQGVTFKDITHFGHKCGGCGFEDIFGPRFHCDVCPNYDLCATCFLMRPAIHEADHLFRCLFRDVRHGKSAAYAASASLGPQGNLGSLCPSALGSGALSQSASGSHGVSNTFDSAKATTALLPDLFDDKVVSEGDLNQAVLSLISRNCEALTNILSAISSSSAPPSKL